MIQPEDIRRKALNQYSDFQRAWLDGQSFFPKEIRCDKTVDRNLAAAIASVRHLRSQSKEHLGYGYTIEWEERNSRTHGRNLFPKRIYFETPRDLLKLIGKEREFAQFTRAAQKLRGRYPQLEQWIRTHRREVAEAAGNIDDLMLVVDYLMNRPRPNLFARELPLPVDTKFIERNHRILRAWLDRVLPPHAIRADEDHFDRRFGLRYLEPLIFLRFLDEAIQRNAASPWSECAVPLHVLADYPIAATHVVIVENRVNLRTLPQVAGAIAMGGLGNGVTDLRYIAWLFQLDLWYWGDLDADGFEILSRMRTMFPHTRSLLMDRDTLQAFRPEIGTAGNGRTGEVPSNLTPAEGGAFRICSHENLRIEQERIPQPFVIDYLKNVFPGRCEP